jgi:hypothetical protein
MIKLVVTAVALIGLFGVSGCVGIGKGKAPPAEVVPPIISKG